MKPNVVSHAPVESLAFPPGHAPIPPNSKCLEIAAPDIEISGNRLSHIFASNMGIVDAHLARRCG